VSQPFLMAGRSLKNYRELNHEIEPGFVVDLCVACQQGIVLSPEGKAQLDAAKKDNQYGPVGAICTMCAMLLTPPGSEIRQSAHAREQERNSPFVASVAEFLRRKA